MHQSIMNDFNRIFFLTFLSKFSHPQPNQELLILFLTSHFLYIHYLNLPQVSKPIQFQIIIFHYFSPYDFFHSNLNYLYSISYLDFRMIIQRDQNNHLIINNYHNSLAQFLLLNLIKFLHLDFYLINFMLKICY